jgi:hypothetical protein
MGKHVYSPFMLVCTLSTRAGGKERTLPRQDSRIAFNKKLPGIF